MSVFEERGELLDHLEFKLGPTRGRLAAAIDILSDAQIAVGTHAAYCKQPRDPTRPTRDIEDVLRRLDHVKELLLDLRGRLEAAPPA